VSAVVIVVVVIIGAIFATVILAKTSSTTPPTCVLPGIPVNEGPFLLRVVSDSNQTPIAGAEVTAISQSATYSCNGLTSLSTSRTIETFTTNNATEWHQLRSQNDGTYSIVVDYSGQSYDFSASFGNPGSATCVSLYIPSGRTNVTNMTESQTICPSTITTTETATAISASTVIPQGYTYQVQSSYDCLAGHFAQPFNVSTTSLLEGAISASQPGVTIYVTTAESAQTVSQGHPSAWLYSSGLTNSATFNVILSPGSYMLWIEGADLGCGATIVTPLEQMTTVAVT
jgi:hypothetical protein